DLSKHAVVRADHLAQRRWLERNRLTRPRRKIEHNLADLAGKSGWIEASAIRQNDNGDGFIREAPKECPVAGDAASMADVPLLAIVSHAPAQAIVLALSIGQAQRLLHARLRGVVEQALFAQGGIPNR